MTKKDVERLGPTARCPTCANTMKGISGCHAHHDECRDRIGKLLMEEGVQRVESYFERARVPEETGSGGTATSSGSTTVVTHAQTPKRKADDETVETDLSKKRRTAGVAGTPMPTVHVGGSSGSGCHGHSVSITTTEQRVVAPPEVPQDTRKCIEDMEISQFEVKSEVSEVQGVCSRWRRERESFTYWPVTVPTAVSEMSLDSWDFRLIRSLNNESINFCSVTIVTSCFS